MDSADHLTSTEAARTLGIKLETLYAYVSRGLLRSTSSPGSRSRTYLRSDVEQLAQRRLHRRSTDSAARSALDWGLPVLDTELTLIENERLFYRGVEVTALAQNSSLERVAALLWLGDEDREDELFGETLQPTTAQLLGNQSNLDSLHQSGRFVLAVQLAQQSDPDAGALSRAASLRAGVRSVLAIASAAALLRRRRRGSVAEVLAQAWCPGRPEFVGVLNAALILCADHELNVSSFSARCIASSGAPMYEAVCGGLCALRGFRHGGHSDRVEALLREVGVQQGLRTPTVKAVRRRLSARLQRGELLPGFGQQLYPNGDPRYTAILKTLQAALPRTGVVQGAVRVAEQGAELTGAKPTVDLALATVAAAVGLPLGAAWSLFAVGRSVGWVAHALEEQERGKLIRPRARYVGPMPRN